MIKNNFLQFNMHYFFASKFKLYLYLVSGLVLLLVYGSYIFLFHHMYDFIPKPFHIFTYNIDKYYQLVYWVLIPFILLCLLASQIYKTSIYITIRLNSYWKIISYYFIQISLIALWGVFLIAVITIACFPTASKVITLNDLINIFFLLTFLFLNFVNLGLLLTILAKKFSELISFITVLIVVQCDQYIFGHLLFETTKLLYRPNFLQVEGLISFSVNLLIMFLLFITLTIQLQKKEG